MGVLVLVPVKGACCSLSSMRSASRVRRGGSEGEEAVAYAAACAAAPITFVGRSRKSQPLGQRSEWISTREISTWEVEADADDCWTERISDRWIASHVAAAAWSALPA
jgi:hypothetical protein